MFTNPIFLTVAKKMILYLIFEACKKIRHKLKKVL